MTYLVFILFVLVGIGLCSAVLVSIEVGGNLYKDKKDQMCFFPIRSVTNSILSIYERKKVIIAKPRKSAFQKFYLQILQNRE